MSSDSTPIPQEAIDAAVAGVAAVCGPALAKRVRRQLQQPTPRPSKRSTDELRVALTDRERRFMEELEVIPGNDSTARRQIQGKLRELVGKPVKEFLVKALQRFLKGRDFAVQCTKEKCHKPASLRWGRDRKSRADLGGYLRYSHTGPHGEPKMHECFAQFPAFIVVTRRPKSKSP